MSNPGPCGRAGVHPGLGPGGAARGRPACSASFPGPGRFLAFTPGMQRLQQIMENKEDGGKAEQNVSGTLKKFGSVAQGKIQERNRLWAKVLRGRGAESRAQRVPLAPEQGGPGTGHPGAAWSHGWRRGGHGGPLESPRVGGLPRGVCRVQAVWGLQGVRTVGMEQGRPPVPSASCGTGSREQGAGVRTGPAAAPPPFGVFSI